jgi:hypothetical protein
VSASNQAGCDSPCTVLLCRATPPCLPALPVQNSRVKRETGVPPRCCWGERREHNCQGATAQKVPAGKWGATPPFPRLSLKGKMRSLNTAFPLPHLPLPNASCQMPSAHKGLAWFRAKSTKT